jgi:serine protease
MTSPHVAGAAAQLHAGYPAISHLAVKTRLMERGDPTPALDGRIVSGKRLNLANALDTEGAPVLTDVRVTPASFDPSKGETATLTWTQNEPRHATIETPQTGEVSPILRGLLSCSS